MLTGKEKKLLEAIEPCLAPDGVEVVMLEIVGAKKAPVVRVYIDTHDGVGFDELAAAQSKVSRLLDKIDPFPGAYTLEVSSPGIDRPLRTREHFEKFAGEKVQIRTVGPLDGRSNFKGELRGIKNEDVVVDIDGVYFKIPFESIKRANVIGSVEF